MFMTRILRIALANRRERKKRAKSHRIELEKFNDARRIEIFSKVNLTSQQQKEIDDLYEQNYGKKIPYIWHRYYTAFTGKFDKYYFPELLFIPEFERFMNLNISYAKVFEDKNVLPYIAQSASIKMPGTMFSRTAGIIRNSKNEVISEADLMSNLSDLGEAFVKPSIDSCSGQGCQVIDVKNGIDIVSGENIKCVLKNKGDDWVLQERIVCHESIRKIYANSVNTFRVMTYRWKNEILCTPSIMRIGQGGANVDNAHAGGMFIAIDKDGSLHKEAFTEFRNVFTEHPNTHIVYENYKIDLFPKVLDAAIKCHSLIPQLGSINWDFTIDQEGNPVLIEANIVGGSVWLFEIAHGCGIFGEKTPEILQWLRLMNNMKPKDRKNFKFGVSSKVC